MNHCENLSTNGRKTLISVAISAGFQALKVKFFDTPGELALGQIENQQADRNCDEDRCRPAPCALGNFRRSLPRFPGAAREHEQDAGDDQEKDGDIRRPHGLYLRPGLRRPSHSC